MEKLLSKLKRLVENVYCFWLGLSIYMMARIMMFIEKCEN